MGTILYIIVVFLGVFCLVTLCLYKIKNSDVYCHISFVLAILVFIVVVLKFSMELLPDSLMGRERRYHRYENLYTEMGGRYLAKYLSIRKDKPINRKIIVIDYPKGITLYGSQYSGWIIKGLKEGLVEFGGHYEITAVENAVAKDESSRWFTAEDFDRLVVGHPEAGIIVSLVGLPSDMENLTFAQKMEKIPRFVFFGGNLDFLSKAIQYKMVMAVVTYAPGVSLGGKRKPKPEEIEKEFFEKFILIDDKNIRDAEFVFPVLFK